MYNLRRDWEGYFSDIYTITHLRSSLQLICLDDTRPYNPYSLILNPRTRQRSCNAFSWHCHLQWLLDGPLYHVGLHTFAEITCSVQRILGSRWRCLQRRFLRAAHPGVEAVSPPRELSLPLLVGLRIVMGFDRLGSGGLLDKQR